MADRLPIDLQLKGGGFDCTEVALVASIFWPGQSSTGCTASVTAALLSHDDVIKWKHFPRYWPFVRGIHRSAMNSPHKGKWRGDLMFSSICAWINNRQAVDLRHHRAHYDITVMREVSRGCVSIFASRINDKLIIIISLLINIMVETVTWTDGSFNDSNFICILMIESNNITI